MTHCALIRMTDCPSIGVAEIHGGQFDGEHVALISFGLIEVPSNKARDLSPLPIAFPRRVLAQFLEHCQLAMAELDSKEIGGGCDNDE